MITEAQVRAIAEALGWEGFQHPDDGDVWRHEMHGMELDRPPHLTADTTLGRAMCYDAIVWLIETNGICVCSDSHYASGDWSTTPTSTALEAAMIRELGI